MGPLLLVANQTAWDHRENEHPERPERIEAVEAGIRGAGVRLEDVDAGDATDDDLLLVHTPAHLNTVAAHTRTGEPFDADTYCTDASDAAARRAAGMAVEAARRATVGRHAIALCRPPGHHATANEAMGFCLYNNVAVAAARLLADGDVDRLAVIDIDVHHGNGTQDIFYADPRVLYASLHQWPFYPGTGSALERGEAAGYGTTLNCPISAGTPAQLWLAAFDELVLPAIRHHRPDVILVSCGFDAHEDDPLAGLRLTDESYASAARHLLDLAAERDLGTAWMLEGGYSLEALRASGAAVARELGA